MFWGAVVKQNQNYKLGKSEELASPIIHLSNIITVGGSGKTTVYAKVNGKDFVIGQLEANKVEQQRVDLYFRVDQNVEFYFKGQGQIHLTGFFEIGSDAEDGDIEETDESEEIQVAKTQPKQEVKKPEAKKPE